MNKLASCVGAVSASICTAVSCSQVTEVSTAELQRIVQRDGIAFDLPSIPEEVIDGLASHRVVVVGETHFLREHRELIVQLLRELHARGFRQLLFEWTQAADWLLADFVEDRGLEPEWEPPLSIGGDMLRAIRDLNRTLPEGELIRVHGIDVTLEDYGGDESFLGSLRALARHLSDPGPLSSFLQADYDTRATQRAQLEILKAGLEDGRADLLASWGEDWYDIVLEMVDVELVSVEIRALRRLNYDASVGLREEAMKWLTDIRLEGYPNRTLINVGGNHAQKRRLKGTAQEWLGDYLVHRSQPADGSVIVLVVTAARIIPTPGSGLPGYDLGASPENELFRVMNQTWPDEIVFLPVTDPVFSRDGVPMNFEGTIHVGAPKRHYDVFLLLPTAHRVPVQ